MPLYISIIYKLMRANGTHEGTIEQIQRLFATRIYNGGNPGFDAEGRIRIDDREMRPEIQDAVKEIWPLVTTATLRTLTAFDDYQQEFLKLFGFGLPDVDYDAAVDPHVTLQAE